MTKTTGVNLECSKRWLVFWTLVVPASYLIGYAYYLGQLAGYGLSADAFPISVPDVYVDFYFVLRDTLLRTVATLLKVLSATWPYFVIFAITIVVITVLYRKERESFNYGRTYQVVEKAKAQMRYTRNHWARAMSFAFAGSTLVLFIIYLLSAITLLFWAFPYGAYKHGRHAAMSDLAHYLHDGCTANNLGWSKCRDFTNASGKTVVKGYLIAASSDHIAVFTGDKVVVLPSKQLKWHRDFETICN